ncbi:Exopolyphosphatase [Exophiala xenobiotica]|uniref:Exopolyphosphatase n=1 Tax=Vermiconidia calcicola TaxID=1690605 RepID=A0AAV9QG52_9PEZI|nr:Exopolyphosphatase [Exophiala xenobiotica]KAK5541129.1 Exopolyphosphatase [Vermiconidia calcicola]KAK5549378.1 Exopolyphosphatase [Chaetothyriales sp. CCFEE 6169]KAK5247263.1 Exopolyphosphatase [Exophiala xenobiotica]KAK5270415.1 Exopolyphosphatase [Exophiala xenobiotica]
MAEEIRQTNRMDTKEIMPNLSTYLPRIRRAVVSSSALKSSQQPSSHVNSTTSIDAPKGGTRTTLVMGNPSADLDSFISAVVLSYFYNLRSSQSRMMGDDDRANNKNGQTSDRSKSKSKSRIFVPILNLPGVRANELWRLRPEFGVALRLALGETTSRIGRVDIGDQNGGGGGGGGGKTGEEGKMNLLEDVITIADVLADRESCLHGVFVIPGHADMGTKASDDSADEQEKQELFLVDHNAPSIAIHGMTDETIRSRFDVVGCIDHHVDEGYVPNDADPRIVRTGIGSCTSLVVRHLRDEGMWPSSSSSFSSHHGRESDLGDGRRQGSGEVDIDGLKQIARFALAPVLIDTSNLKATGDKCSDLDREVVRFLESFIVGDDQAAAAAAAQGNDTRTSSETNGQAQAQGWDRDAFHRAISTTKTNSLNLLNMQEIFDRDYKSWTEEPQTSSSGEEASEAMVNIGISSLVKPLSWLVEHAGGVDKFLDEIERFARDEDRNLGVFAMLTRAGDGKEVVVLAMDESVKKVIGKFEARGQEELKLRTWQEDGTVIKALDERLKKGVKGGWKIWWMGDTSKSRKQVGPLIREAVRNI